jgi:hypothetical protein
MVALRNGAVAKVLRISYYLLVELGMLRSSNLVPTRPWQGEAWVAYYVEEVEMDRSKNSRWPSGILGIRDTAVKIT